MMGPKKLSAIRADLRQAFGMSDKVLLAWFNREIEELQQHPKGSKAGEETLLSLRNALLKKGKKKASGQKRKQAHHPSKG